MKKDADSEQMLSIANSKDWNVGSAAMEAYESTAAKPEFQSALQAATGNETEIAKLHTKHLSDFGGYYLADVSFQRHTHIHNADSEHMLSIVNSLELADSGKAWRGWAALYPHPPLQL